MARTRAPAELVQHAPEHAMDDPGEIEAFHDRCSALMRALLDELARTPDRPRTLGEIEDAMGWPRRRIASVLGGGWRLRTAAFGGRRPYPALAEGRPASGGWEAGMDPARAPARG